MAYTPITLKSIVRSAGTEDTTTTQTAAVADGGHVDGHSFVNDGRVVLSVRNGAVGRSLYVYIPATVDGQAVTMQTYTVNANTDYFVGPFPTAMYNQTGGLVYIAADAAGALTYQPWRLS